MASSGKCGDNVTWTLSDDGVLTLSGSGATYDYGSEYDSSYPPWYDHYDGAKDILSIVVKSGITRLGEKLFYCSFSARSVSLPNTLQTIGRYAFAGFGVWTVRDEGLKLHVVIPEGVTAIEDSAFSLSFLTSVSLPSTLQTIGEDAFDNAWFTSITIPASVTRIGAGALGPRLTSIEVMSGNTMYCTIDGVLFNITKTALVDYPKAKEGTSYTVPDSVTTIFGSAFYGAEYLTSIILPDTLVYIGDSAFGQLALTSIDIPDTVTYIGSYAFSGTSLSEVRIPEKLRIINDGTFENTKLTNVTIPKSVTSIGYEAFDGTGITSVIIPENVSSIGDKAFPVENMVSYSVDEANQHYSSVDGVLYNADKTELLIYPACKTGEKYTVPNGVKKINGSYTLDYVRYLKKIILPASLEELYCYPYGDIETLELKGKTPPALPKSYHSASLTTIIVPYGCVETYKAAEGWKDYADIIVEAEGFPLMQFITGILSELNAGVKREPIAYLYNGVRLPDINSVYTPELQKTHPYAYMYLDKNTSFYTLVVNETPIYYNPDSPFGKYVQLSIYIRYKLNDGVWEFVEENGVVVVYTKAVDGFEWTNVDIRNYEGDVLYLAASDPVPVYE